MQVVLPDSETCSTFTIQPERPLDEDEFFEFCENNDLVRIEREPNGTIVVMPLGGAEASHRGCVLGAQLSNWSMSDGRGFVAAHGGFRLPKGAVRGPNTCWVLKSRLAGFSRREKRRFLALCPDFVIELICPSDRLPRVKAKMREWIDNGTALGWLIDADRRTVYIYRPDREPETCGRGSRRRRGAGRGISTRSDRHLARAVTHPSSSRMPRTACSMSAMVL